MQELEAAQLRWMLQLQSRADSTPQHIHRSVQYSKYVVHRAPLLSPATRLQHSTANSTQMQMLTCGYGLCTGGIVKGLFNKYKITRTLCVSAHLVGWGFVNTLDWMVGPFVGRRFDAFAPPLCGFPKAVYISVNDEVSSSGGCAM